MNNHNSIHFMVFRKRVLLFLTGLYFLYANTYAQSNSLTLEEAIRTGIENNFQIKIEKNNQRSNIILNNWGTAGIWPSVSVNSSIGIASNSLEQELANGTIIKRDGAILRNSNAGMLISWRIFDGMRMFATKKRLEELDLQAFLHAVPIINDIQF